MENTQHDYNDPYTTLVQSTDMVNTQQTHVRAIWRTPLGHDIYEHFNFSQPPLDPHTSVGVEAGPFGQTIDCPIKQVFNPTAMSVHL
jgi:hypothetical protein